MYISPNGKKYIGQTINTFNQRAGGHRSDYKLYLNRFNNLKYKKTCEEFYKEVELVGGFDKFTKIILLNCENKDLNENEKRLIIEHNTVRPNGLNMLEGGIGKTGPTSEEAKENQRKTRNNFIKSMKDNPEKLKKTERAKELPMYTAYFKNGPIEGYKIYHHPHCLTKTFSSKNYGSMDNAKTACLNYLNILNDPNYLPIKVDNPLPKGISKRGNGYRIRFIHNEIMYDRTYMKINNPDENLERCKSYYYSIKTQDEEYKEHENIYVQSDGSFLAKFDFDDIKYSNKYDKIFEAIEWLTNKKTQLNEWKMYRAQMPIGLINHL